MAILLIMFSSMFHSFYVSVTTLYFKPDEKLIQVEIRVFMDDLENELSEATNEKVLMAEMDKQTRKKVLADYFSENLIINNKGKKQELVFIGHEIEELDNVVWCYFEIYKVKKLEDLKMKNTILLKSLEDQENIIHLKNTSTNKTNSERTHGGKHWADF